MKQGLAIAGIVTLVAGVWAAWDADRRVSPRKESSRLLRVCSDPNNMPFSNDRQQGFENRIAAVLARELDARLEYVWWAQRRGYVRNTINEGLCDLYIGIPSAMEMLSATTPYYRSTYVFVCRQGSTRVDSLDAAALRKLRIGVQLVGDDYANTPPVHALAKRGIIHNVRGYSVIGDYSQANPPARIIEAVAKGEIDVAIAWGPMAGYFARKQPVPLEVVPLRPQKEGALPFVYDISMGVRRGDGGLKTEIERAIAANRAEIRRILEEYGVPLLPTEGS